MDRADGRDADILVKAPDHQFADLSSAPVRLLLLEGKNQRFDLTRKLIGIPNWTPRSVIQRLRA